MICASSFYIILRNTALNPSLRKNRYILQQYYTNTFSPKYDIISVEIYERR